MVSFLLSYAFKDLWRQKVRTIFGILGISISILLLSTVSIAMDSLSSSFADYLTSESANQDITLEVRHYYGEPSNRTDYFNYNPVMAELQQNLTEIEHYLPRATFWGATLGNPDSPIDEENRYGFRLSALNISYEQSIEFGRWKNLEEGLDISQGLAVNSCMINPGMAEYLNVTVGDTINLQIWELWTSVNLTIASTFEQEQIYPSDDWSEGPPSIVVDFDWWGELANKINKNPGYANFSWVGATNKLVLLLENAQSYYDIRDIEGSEIRVESIGEDIVNTLGIEAWSLDYPKLEMLFVSEYMAMIMNLIFMIITIVAMMISGILIHGILSTSVEERIQEYGINRVLGARSNYNVKLILLQGSLLAFMGTSLGLIGATTLVKYGAIPLIESLLEDNQEASDRRNYDDIERYRREIINDRHNNTVVLSHDEFLSQWNSWSANYSNNMDSKELDDNLQFS